MVYSSPQGEDGVSEVGFDLDRGPSEALVVEGASFTARKYLSEHQLTLARDERLTFNARVRTGPCACKFVLEISFSQGPITIISDNGGEPWQLVGFAGHYERAYYRKYFPEDRLVPCKYPHACLVGQ
jgi:hypothetical protein